VFRVTTTWPGFDDLVFRVTVGIGLFCERERATDMISTRMKTIFQNFMLPKSSEFDVAKKSSEFDVAKKFRI